MEIESALNALLVRREMRACVRNLKLLDWIVADGDRLAESEAPTWSGVSSVIDSLWARWVGTDASSTNRAEVMKRLSCLEGEGLSHGIGISQLSASERAVLPELESREFLAVREERIWFRHDTLGDWARLRVLVERGVGAIAEVAPFPRWHDAIRLFGQRLLETDRAPPARWIDAVRSLDHDEPAAIAARDMMLESLFASAHAQTLLESAWSALCADSGLLLRRLLGRFLFAATIPDPRVAVVGQTDLEQAELAAYWRYPWWPLWPATLAVLAAHATDIGKLAPIEGATICTLWLQSMPVGMMGRRNAAQVAVAIGREVQAARGEEHTYYRDREDKVVYEAVQFAAHELPDDVSAICLELSRRRPDPPEVIARARAHRERVNREVAERLAKHPPPKRRRASILEGSPYLPQGVLRAQFPDGPSKRVDEAFQIAVLDTQGFLALAAARPNVAREVLLACCLQEPRHESDEHDEMLDRFGVESIPALHPPMFFRGPWLPLLRQNPNLGVDCIVRLVNQATQVWASHRRRRSGSAEKIPPEAIVVDTASGPVEYLGDMQVYGWHRERLCGSHLLVSALMALEKYLYERCDQSLPVDDLVNQILTSGRSNALLAVLVAAGMHRPSLFGGPLAPLLGLWQLYGWDMQLMMDGNLWQVGFFQWSRSGERVFNIVRDWHTMPHRKHMFRDCAVRLMLSHGEIRDSFKVIRTSWQSALDSGECTDPDGLELLVARFNPENYRLNPRGDGYAEVILEWPEPLKSKTEESLRISAAGSRLLTFPFECRRLLDAAAGLTNEIAEKIWAQVRDLASLSEAVLESETERGRCPDAIMGGIAVLVCLAPDWLEADRDRTAWCERRLVELLEKPPARTTLDSEHSISTDRWHSFIADIAIRKLVNSPDNQEVRAFAANALMSFWYATTAVALKCAHQHRERLGADFVRLVNLAVLWSALRGVRIPYQTTETEWRASAARRSRLLGAFVRGEIPDSMLDWASIGTLAVHAEERIRRRRFPATSHGDKRTEALQDPADPKSRRSSRDRVRRTDPGFDIEALRYAFSWLPTPSATPPEEQARNHAWLSELLGVSLRMIPSESTDGDDVEGTPYQFDLWVYGLVAKYVAQTPSSDDAATLWRPILELGPGAHYWIETFLREWTVSALTAAPTIEQFFARWREMIAFALKSPAWMPKPQPVHFRVHELWEHLLGMHLGAEVVGADGHQPYFSKMVPLFYSWAEAYLTEDRSLRAFLGLLGKPGARPLLAPAIPWLLAAAERVHRVEWARDPIADELGSVLRLAWTWHSEAIASEQTLRDGFGSLLNLAVTHQSRVAMGLRDQIGRTVSGRPPQD